MSAPLFNFRLPRQDHKAIAKAATELHCDRSSLARLAIRELLGRLQREGLISEAPSALILR
jgi:hypothetical protein